MLEYNHENFNKVSDAIMNNLTPDLLPKKWVEKNKTNPTFGHCHTASACLQKIFGNKNIKLYRGLDDEAIWHWWCVDLDGNIIDLTSRQYYDFKKEPPYEKGEKAGMLGFAYRERVVILLDKVKQELNII